MAGMLVRAIAMRTFGRVRAHISDLMQWVVPAHRPFARDRLGHLGGAAPEARHLLSHFPEPPELLLQKVL